MISIGSKRQLNDEDVWMLGYEFHHRRLHEAFRELRGSVLRRLLKANGIDLVILTTLGILELLANYSVPVLLQRLLSSMEDLQASKRTAITYAVLSLAVRLIACQSSVFSLWFGRRCYERTRGEMITMLYEKTLGRKIGFQEPEKGVDQPEASANGSSQGAANGDRHEKKPFSTLATIFNMLCGARFKSNEELKKPADMGKILNLMRNDVYEVAQRFWEFQSLITRPFGLIFSVALIWRLMGPSCLIGVLVVILAQAINVLLARALLRWERVRRAATDTKLQIISQFVEAIRHLRWYGWQHAWLEKIMEARQRELHLRVITSLWNMSIGFFNSVASGLFPVLAFYAYTTVAGRPLRIDIAFPALQLFGMLTANLREIPNLITVVLNAMIAVGRIEDFMSEPDKDEKYSPAHADAVLGLQDASFAWPGAAKNVLHNITLSFPQGLTVICGKVASGKTALLQALLGELDGRGGELIRPDKSIGYCAQTPWLQSMSIRENILFSAPFEPSRYKEVIDACALTADLAEFKSGDLTNVGENGVGLSGGQKARVALARAVYSRSEILLLDDPIAALDQQTAELIVRRCFSGPLLVDRMVVLVTHRTDLCYHIADLMVEMVAGTAHILDHESTPADSLQTVLSNESRSANDKDKIAEQQSAAVPDKFIEDEHRAHGGVEFSIYWEYIKAGKLRWWLVLLVVQALYRLIAVGQSWFLKSWGEAYNEKSEMQPAATILNSWHLRMTSGPFDSLPSPDSNLRPWLIGFFLIAISQTILNTISQCFMLVIIYVAGRRMFKDIMERVSQATFRFYDVTPIGRLMNRMTSDIGVIDGGISRQFQAVLWLSISWTASIVVIGSVTPVFLVFSSALALSFVLIFRRFLPTSQSLRRLEMVSLSPLMSNFGALLDGLTTVRAFGAQRRFQDRVIAVVDTFQKMDHFYWSLQAWLMYRFDALSAFSTFILTMLALFTGVSPGLTAFVLIAAGNFVNSTHALCRQYGELQMKFVSVERVVELLHIEKEPTGTVTPPAWWPSFAGDIVFEAVTLRYAPHLDPALCDVSCTIKGGSKTAIVGRTGSGKSTLALSILGIMLPESGRILIDGLDLASVDKQMLRTRVTFLAQDPVLFPGSMRENLDPLEEHSDDECLAVLERVCARQQWLLTTTVETGGRNLSQGQRQLVGLARAVLRRSAIIILDEATASIDKETAMQIQQVLYEEMSDSTVITIAHRLEAVRNADYCIVLGHGEIVEQGPASAMLNDEA